MIRRLIFLLALLACCNLLPATWAQSPATTQAATRFQVVDVFVDSGDRALAAWQVELVAASAGAKVVGVEGGEHKNVYRDPPYYDPAALAGGRIILASYTTSEAAPKGKTLVARVHLQVIGDHRLTITPIAAADPAGQPIQATASIANAPTTRTLKEKE